MHNTILLDGDVIDLSPAESRVSGECIQATPSLRTFTQVNQLTFEIKHILQTHFRHVCHNNVIHKWTLQVWYEQYWSNNCFYVTALLIIITLWWWGCAGVLRFSDTTCLCLYAWLVIHIYIYIYWLHCFNVIVSKYWLFNFNIQIIYVNYWLPHCLSFSYWCYFVLCRLNRDLNIN